MMKREVRTMRNLNEFFSINTIDLIAVMLYIGFAILFALLGAEEGLLIAWIFLPFLTAWLIKIANERSRSK